MIEPLESRRLLSALALVAQTEYLAGSPQIQLDWTGGKPGQSFVIERSFAGGKWHPYARTRARSFTDTADHLPALYAYRILGPGETSNVAQVDLTLTNFCTEVVYSWNTHHWNVELSWTEDSPAVTGFTLERSKDGGTTWVPLDGPIELTYAAPDSYTKNYSYFDYEVPDGCTLTYRIIENM